MRAAEQRARAALLDRAQDRLDGILGQEIVAPFVGKDLDDELLFEIRRVACERLRAEDDAFAPLVVAVERVGKLVSLTARFRARR